MDWFLVISILAALTSSVVFATKSAFFYKTKNFTPAPFFEKIKIYTKKGKTTLGSESHTKRLFEEYAGSGVTVLAFDKSDKVEDIPPEIALISTLEELYIKEIPIVSLPLEIGNLPVIRVIDIRGANLQEIPPQVGNLQSLRELHLPNNQIISIPTEIVSLQNLRVLELSGNPLSKEKVEELKTLMPNTEIIFDNFENQ